MLNMRVSRTWGFGGESGKAHGGEGTAAGAPEPRHARGLGGRGLGGGGGFGLGGATDRRYALTVSASGLNVLNNVNLAPPVSTLGSPSFGRVHESCYRRLLGAGWQPGGEPAGEYWRVVKFLSTAAHFFGEQQTLEFLAECLAYWL